MCSALGTTTAAVKSALQRARARVNEVADANVRVAEPTEPQARALLHQYIAAFEHADPVALEQVLREDVTLELPPARVWFSGTSATELATVGLGSPGDWRMIPTAANGQPAAAAYHRREDGTYHAYAIVVLTATTTGIARIVVFTDAALFTAFDLPSTLTVGST